MKRNNYHRAKTGRCKDDHNVWWYYAVYDPNYQHTITEQIRAHKRYLYHSAPAYAYDNIVDNGLIVNNEKRTYDYGENRLFLYAGEPSDNEYLTMMRNIILTRSKTNKNDTGDYTLYTIRVSKMPDDVEFYTDPHGKNKDFIFTKSNIPYSAIIDEEDVRY